MKNLQPILAAAVIALTALFFAILSMAGEAHPDAVPDAPVSMSLKSALPGPGSFDVASFGPASFGPASFGPASFGPASFDPAAGSTETLLARYGNCPCPAERKETACVQDLCAAGIVQNMPPESRRPAAAPAPILSDDLSGIAREPDHTPPRLSA